MSKFEGFRDLSFMEQIALCSEVERDADPADIPHLQALFLEPVGDAAVDTMLRNALHNLLFKDHAALLQALENADKPMAVFCTALAGEAGLEAAVPALLERGRQWADDPEALHPALLALVRIGDPAALELFREHLHHRDDFISSLCIEQLGVHRDAAMLPELKKIIDDNEAPENYEQCQVDTWKAIEAVAAMGSQDALEYLAAKLHHENPTARRIIHRCLVEAGDQAVPCVAHMLRQGASSDERIMAANVLGFSGARKATGELINALDDGLLQEPNERFAAYEALGRVPGMKGLVFLEDALWHENDPLLLLAVVKSLDAHGQAGMAQGIARKIGAKAQEGVDTVQHLLDAVVGAEATSLFTALQQLPELAGPLLDTALASADKDHLLHFAAALEATDSEGASGMRDAALRLRTAVEQAPDEGQTLRLLAIDDSDAMRKFYIQAGAELGYKVQCAEHGQAALDIIEGGENFDLVVVDMNMPVMDGIEFTTKLRALPGFDALPVIMASTESARSQAQLAKKAGVNSFIVKPFTKDVFKNKIAKLLT